MKQITEKQRIANNLALYIKINGYTNKTFASKTKLSPTIISNLTSGKMRDEKKFHLYIDKITDQLGLEEGFLASSQEKIAAEPIHFQTENKLHTGDDKFNVLSLLLKIGEIHYEQ